MEDTMTTIATPTRQPLVTAEADPATGTISATALLAASQERVFRALTSTEICDWWVRPGVFDTRDWSGEVVVGSRWQAGGLGGGQPYRLEGEFLAIEAPLRLVHSWKAVGAPGSPSTVTYRLEPAGDGVRLELDHSGLMVPDICEKTRAGWETSLCRLAEILAAERVATS
jgi:uncharacterized protein YndB with AHSA1/START domain